MTTYKVLVFSHVRPFPPPLLKQTKTRFDEQVSYKNPNIFETLYETFIFFLFFFFLYFFQQMHIFGSTILNVIRMRLIETLRKTKIEERERRIRHVRIYQIKNNP